MNKRHRLSILLVAVALVSQSCGLYVSSNHRTEDYTPMFADASAGNLDAVKVEVQKDRGALKAREWDNATLLHVAVQQNQKAVAAFLLDAGADANAVTKDGLTPLHMAAQNGNTDMMQLLLSHKAKINAVDSKDWTPLDRAIKWEHGAAAEFLKQHGARSGIPNQ